MPAAGSLPVPPGWRPTVDPVALEQVLARCSAAGLAVERDRPLGPLTTLGVGGAAAAFVALPDPAAARALARALAGTSAEQVPLLVMGKGSNTLVSDAGFPGLVVKLGAGHKWLRRDGLSVSAGAGEAMPALAAWAATEGLAGLEFAAGIPATVGGSVQMNAGAHGSDTAARLTWVELLTPGDGGVARFGPEALGFGYRTCVLPPRAIVLAAGFELVADDPAAVRARLDELRAWRRATQPLRERNCGSVFTNPPGDSAGRLLEAAGCKGRLVGGARISAKHANFLTVEPGGTASDVLQLLGVVRQAVVQAGGPLLTPEVRIVG